MFVCCVDDLGKFGTRFNDKSHKRRLARGERIFRLYQDFPHNILEVVDEAHGFFRMTSVEGLWYYVSLATHFFGCPSKSSSCKHLVGLKTLLKTHYPHIHMNDDKKLSSEVNVSEDVGHVNANFGEHLLTMMSNLLQRILMENLILNIIMKMYIHQHYMMNKNNYSCKGWRT